MPCRWFLDWFAYDDVVDDGSVDKVSYSAVFSVHPCFSKPHNAQTLLLKIIITWFTGGRISEGPGYFDILRDRAFTACVVGRSLQYVKVFLSPLI